MTNLDVLRATFPAGTLTGAPKVRAMEIIDELEPVKRGIYGGAVRLPVASRGDMDLAIAIRTRHHQGRQRCTCRPAAGVVADSVPELEWKETEAKARAVLRAAEQVRRRPRQGLLTKTMLLMIDNYDSFTYNLVQYFGELGEDVRVYRNDEITLDEHRGRSTPTSCVLSPGPCTPNEAGICVSAIRELHRQACPSWACAWATRPSAQAFGGNVIRAQSSHARQDLRRSTTDRKGVFAGLPERFTVIALSLAGRSSGRACRPIAWKSPPRTDGRRDHGRAPQDAGTAWKACSSTRNRSCPNTATRC